jgi:hypothetical protein
VTEFAGCLPVVKKYFLPAVETDVCCLPRSLLHTGDLTLVCQFTEADTADAVFTHVSVRTAADLASVVFSGRELLLLLLL